MSNSKRKSIDGVLFVIVSILTIVFCALRACDIVQWSIVLVLSPMLIYIAICCVLLALVGALCIWEINRTNKQRRG